MFGSAGIRIDGPRPWDIQVTDPRFYRALLVGGSLGSGESYMRGWWHSDDLEETAYRLLRAGLHWIGRALPRQLLSMLASTVTNQQTRGDVLALADRHYNLGNDLFLSFLGEHPMYSSGWFAEAASLDQAQAHKLERICDLLALAPGDRVLEIGGGWGEFARYAAATRGCQITSINVADEQMRHARERCAGLPVEIVKCDYRDVQGSYDKVAAIAMLSHVGHRNLRDFMRIVHDRVRPGGPVLIETIGSRISKVDLDPWHNRYIFPGGVIPSMRQIRRGYAEIFPPARVIEFSRDYVPTLRTWVANLEAAWPALGVRYPETTRLMMRYHLLTSAAAFRAGHLKYWHLLLHRGR